MFLHTFIADIYPQNSLKLHIVDVDCLQEFKTYVCMYVTMQNTSKYTKR